MIFVVGIGLAFFLELLLVSKKNKSQADRILSLWIFFIGLHLLLYYVHYRVDIVSRHPHLIGLPIPLPLIHGPFLYAYTAKLTGRFPKRKIVSLLHFLPVTLDYVLLAFFWFPVSGEEKLTVMNGLTGFYRIYGIVHLFFVIISGVAYVIWSLLLIKRHKQAVRESFSDVEHIDLAWLRFLIFGIAGIWLVIFLQLTFLDDILEQNGLRADFLIFSAVALFIGALGYFGIRQTNIFINMNIESQSDFPSFSSGSEKNVENPRYAKSGLKKDQAEKLQEELVSVMDKEKLFLKSDLSLKELSDKLNIHSNYLSQIINERFGKSFYDFVNEYRIDAFIRAARNPKNKHLTILALAYDSGFNSKSSFNKYFKKVTGKTPSEFMKEQKGESGS